MKKIKLGIIGVGNMGSSHVTRVLAGETPEVELAAIADMDEQRRAWAKERVPETTRIFNDGSEMIQSGACEAVLIAVPHYQHSPLAIEAFAQGLHVLCEKPAGVYTLQVREMNEAAAKSGRVFGMMFNQRTNSLFRKMHDMIASGELGEIRRVNWIITNWFRTQFYYDSGAWRATWDGEGGGVLLNQCPHNLDLLQWICGMPSRVHAFCHVGKWHRIEVEDDVTAYLEYPNGATGAFITTTGDAPGTNRFEVTCDMGKLVFEDDKLYLHRNEVSMREFCDTSDQAFARPKCVVSEVETDGANPQHTGVLNAFAANILHGEPLVAPGEEGIFGLTLSNAMHLSSWLGKTVDVPFDEELFLSELNKRRAASKVKTGDSVIADTEGSYGS